MKWFTQLKLLAANQRSDLPGVDMETYRHTNSIANRCYATLGSPTHIGDSLARDGMNSSRQTLIMNCRFSALRHCLQRSRLAQNSAQIRDAKPGCFYVTMRSYMHSVGQCTPEVPPCSVQHPQYFFCSLADSPCHLQHLTLKISKNR
jgi:hypothetical protein